MERYYGQIYAHYTPDRHLIGVAVIGVKAIPSIKGYPKKGFTIGETCSNIGDVFKLNDFYLVEPEVGQPWRQFDTETQLLDWMELMKVYNLTK